MAKGDYGYNGYIGSSGYGRRRIRVIRLKRKVSIISNEEEGKRRRAFYPMMVTSSGFEIDVAHISYSERGKFNRWLSRWMEMVVDGTAPSGVMTVSIPHYNFTQVCVPETDLNYGEGVTDYAYITTLGFVGASDAINLDLGARMAGVSYFQMPKNNQTSKYFYPAGRQVAGAESLDGTIFDQVAMPGISSPGGDYDDDGFGPQGGI